MKGHPLKLMQTHSVLLTAPLLLLAITACGSAGTSTGQTVTGTVGTINYIIPGNGTVECKADNPDLRPGAGIRVTDPDGTLIGSSALQSPYRDVPEAPDPSLQDPCVYPFTITGLPDAEIYQVALASDPDQVVAFTRQDLEERNWSIQLTIN
jgi:hypothetical protein